MAVQDTVEDNEEKNRQKQSHFIYNYLAWLCQGGSNIGYLDIFWQKFKPGMFGIPKLK